MMRKKKRAARKSVRNSDSDKVNKNSGDENLAVTQAGAEDEAAAEETPSAPVAQAKIEEQEESQTAKTNEADTAVIPEQQSDNAAVEKAAAEKAAVAAEKRVRKQAKERKKAINALRLSDSKARKLLNMVDIGLAFHELVKSDDGKVVDYRVREVNPAFESIMALTADDATGNPASSIYGTRGRAPFLKDIVEAMETGESRVFEGTVRSIKGRLKFSVQPMDKNLFALLVEDASQEAKTRRRLAFLETRVKTVSVERKEVAATLDDARIEAAEMKRQIKTLQGDLDAAAKETARMAASLEREAVKVKGLETAVKAATVVCDNLKAATSDLSNALQAWSPVP
jgi:PAS domain-containing protein